MKCFYKELKEKREFFITQLNNKYAALEWAWFQREITDEEYNQIKQVFETGGTSKNR